MGVPAGAVMAGTERNDLAIIRAETEASRSYMSGFGIETSADGAGLAANPLEVLRVEFPLDPRFQANPAQGRVTA